MDNQLPRLRGLEELKTLSWCAIFSTVLFVGCQGNSTAITKDVDAVSPNDNLIEKTQNFGSKELQGRTQGTTFTIKTSDDSLLITANQLSELLADFDQELSGYIDTSMLSKFNSGYSINMQATSYFKHCYAISYEVFENTNELFDPSVFPLVRAWGFFKDQTSIPSQKMVDSILAFTGFTQGEHHEVRNGELVKLSKGFQLDFNAIAQGYSVDVVADYLDDKGQQSYYIEIGGELRLKGKNADGVNWIIGIDVPSDDNSGEVARDLENYLSLSNVGLATSGNYRKFYEKEGKKYSHTLHPKTGYPVQHNLLSATVVAETAALADAYATAFMVMGVKETMEFISKNQELNIHVYLLFDNPSGRIERIYSKGMEDYFLK